MVAILREIDRGDLLIALQKMGSDAEVAVRDHLLKLVTQRLASRQS